MAKSIQVENTDLQELRTIISDCVKQQLQDFKTSLNFNQKSQEIEIFSRNECAKMLSISSTKLWEITKSLELPCKRIGSKVLYLKTDIVNYLNNVA